MAFKFNFGSSEEPALPPPSAQLRPGRIVAVSEAHREFTKEDEEELRSVIQRSDLEPAVYEGAQPVLRALAHHQETVSKMRVLELGCGHGLPGLYCLSKGAVVDFADYNEEVLMGLTIPNVHLNFPDALSRCRFIAGDWSLLSNIVASQAYDLILCSEVLYFVNSYTKLLDLLTRCVRPSGKILIASKLYYFSCGGGTRQFEELVATKGTLSSSVVKHIEDQQSNIREILQLQLKQRTAH